MRALAPALALVLASACGGDRSALPGPAPARPLPSDADALRSLVAAPVVSACGTPAVDGVLGAGEWDAAVSFRFAAVRPASAGGGEVSATLRAMSDATNLYFAFEYEQGTSAYTQSHTLELDADGSRSMTGGDDVLVLSWYPEPWTAAGGTTLFHDDFRWPCRIEGRPALCGPADDDPFPQASPPAPPPGTMDGGGAVGHAAGRTVVELWHPYAGDDLRDLRAAPGDTIALELAVRLLDACAEYPTCYGDFGYPGAGYRELLLGCGAPPPDETVVTVRIEVKPGDLLPTIQLSSGGTTAVAVLGSPALDVSDVEPATVWFAAAPVRRRDDGSAQAATEDVDGDGRLDLVLHFTTAELRLEPGEVEATLAGRLRDGRAFRGTDVVRVLP